MKKAQVQEYCSSTYVDVRIFFPRFSSSIPVARYLLNETYFTDLLVDVPVFILAAKVVVVALLGVLGQLGDDPHPLLACSRAPLGQLLAALTPGLAAL